MQLTCSHAGGCLCIAPACTGGSLAHLANLVERELKPTQNLLKWQPSAHLADLVEREQLVLGRDKQAVARLRLLQRLCHATLSAQRVMHSVSLAKCIQGTLWMHFDLQAGLSSTAQKPKHVEYGRKSTPFRTCTVPAL